jgi:hypothetical protein
LSDPVVLSIQAYFGYLPALSISLLLALFILKVYVIGAIVTRTIGQQQGIGNPERHPATQQQMAFVMFLYLAISLCGYLWLRNAGFINHQAHGILLASGFVAAMCCIWGAYQTDLRRLIWGPLLMIPFLPSSANLEIPNNHMTRAFGRPPIIGQPGIWTVGNSLPRLSTSAKTYKPPHSEAMVNSQLNAALLGLRLTIKDAPGLPAAGVNMVWPKDGGWWRK